MKNAARAFILFVFASCSSPDMTKGVAYEGSTEQLAPGQLTSDLKQAASGDKLAAHRLGRHFVSLKQRERGLEWLRIASILGSAAAQHDFYILSKYQGQESVAVETERRLWLLKAARARYRPAIDALKD